MSRFPEVLFVLSAPMRGAAFVAAAAVAISGCGATGSGAAGSTSMTSPNPMEHHFGHVLFNDSAQHFPPLRPAAPQHAQAPHPDYAEVDEPSADAPRASDRGDGYESGAEASAAAPERKNLRPLVVPRRGHQQVAKAPKTNSRRGVSRATKKRAPAKRAAAKKAPAKKAPAKKAPAKRPHVETAPHKRVPDAPKKPRAPKDTSDRGLTIEPVSKPEPAPAKKGGLGDGTRRSEVLAAARRLVGVETNFDEQGFLIHLLQVADVSLEAAQGEDIVKALYDDLNENNRVFGPSQTVKPGDLIFFSNTYDRDDDGRTDDWFTMIGVVERMDADGTIQFIGFAKGAIDRLYMNLRRPSAQRDEAKAKTLNSLLRDKRLSDRPFTRYHAGELFASFGSLD